MALSREAKEPAFPAKDSLSWNSGLTKLEYFAAKAMQALLSNPAIIPRKPPITYEDKHLADIAYSALRYAKSMIEALEKEQANGP